PRIRRAPQPTCARLNYWTGVAVMATRSLCASAAVHLAVVALGVHRRQLGDLLKGWRYGQVLALCIVDRLLVVGLREFLVDVGLPPVVAVGNCCVETTLSLAPSPESGLCHG